MKRVLCALVTSLALTGCVNAVSSFNQQPSEVVVQKVDKDDIRDIIKNDKMIPTMELDSEAVFTAVGEGIPPMDTVSPAQARALAKRSAITDGYRQLAGKLYGVKVNAKDTVKDAMLQSSVIEARVLGLIKNASVINQDFKDGLYRVEMELKIDQEKWQELFAY
ncbi:LPP20 family lipoprotein [Campylobacter vicugnae]|uniref:LPP20 family lipoprotein n=1 Tax=Campylobacter vicugnae TaxID=1660076 RepID=A0A1X9SZM6_9BACT|nr:LPP20 family lipoprotein [Campylobacter sp. RM8964]ARR01724.1 LPP20 family lipoprotein [Campylobacter sp. RM8964]